MSNAASHVPDALRRGHTALREALGRAEQSWQHKDQDHFFAASIEAAMWTVALDDFYRSERGESYIKRRDADPDGALLTGMRWARNQGIHNLVSVYAVRGGMSFPLTFPIDFHIVAEWKRRADVSVKLTQNQKRNEASYDQHLAGRGVMETLRRAHGFLWLGAEPATPEGFVP